MTRNPAGNPTLRRWVGLWWLSCGLSNRPLQRGGIAAPDRENR
jgi:hypothetical protein